MNWGEIASVLIAAIAVATPLILCYARLRVIETKLESMQIWMDHLTVLSESRECGIHAVRLDGHDKRLVVLESRA